MYGSISVSYMPDRIIKGSQETYILLESIIKYLFNKEVRYFRAIFGIFYVSKLFGGVEENYRFWDANNYINNTTPIVEDFYEISK